MTSFLNLSGSRVVSTTKSADVTQLVEYGPSTSEVGSSSLLIRFHFSHTTEVMLTQLSLMIIGFSCFRPDYHWVGSMVSRSVCR